MPEEKQEVNDSPIENIVANEETLQEETPPETSEEQVETEETSAEEADSKGDPAADQIEELKKQKAYFQTESQKAKEELRRYREKGDELGMFDERPEERPQEIPRQVKSDGATDRFSDMTDEEVNDYLRENPLVAMQLQNEAFGQKLEQFSKIVEAKTAYQKEAEFTTNKLKQFIEKHNIPSEKLLEKRDKFAEMGIKAPPTTIGQLIIDDFNNEMRSKNIQNEVIKEKSKAAEAVKRQALTQQPGGSAQDQPKELTYEEMLAAKFKKSKEASALDGLF
jgi:hypothetical protein